MVTRRRKRDLGGGRKKKDLDEGRKKRDLGEGGNKKEIWVKEEKIKHLKGRKNQKNVGTMLCFLERNNDGQ